LHLYLPGIAAGIIESKILFGTFKALKKRQIVKHVGAAKYEDDKESLKHLANGLLAWGFELVSPRDQN
jgi:hypothetical protein